MKKMIRTAFMLVLFLVCLYMISINAFAEENNYSYQVNDDGTVTILEYIGKEKTVIIPSEIGGIPVVRIEEKAFELNTKIKEVIIPDSVTSIGKYAFRKCNNLEKIDIYGDVTSIGVSVFAKCRDLKSVVFHGKLNAISNGLFFECPNLVSFKIPDGVTYIGNNAFGYCSNLISIDIPEGVNIIDVNAFRCCDKLVSVTLPYSLEIIEWDAFIACASLEEIYIPKGVTKIGEYAFRYCVNLRKVILPENIEILEDTVFGDCGIVEITVPDSVKRISTYAFSNCVDLSSIFIPDSVTSISEKAFDGCEKLTDIFYGGTQSEWNNLVSKWETNQLENITIHYNYSDVNNVEIAPVDYENLYMTLKEYLESELGYSDNEYTIVENINEVNGIRVKVKFDSADIYIVRIKQKLNGEAYLLYSDAVEKMVYMLGDVNQDDIVNAEDALVILKYSARLISLDEEQQKASDSNRDEIINAIDALNILKLSAHLDIEL